MPKEKQPKPAPKSELLLEVALEAKYFRNVALALPMVLIPNHPALKTPVLLQDNYDFVCWLTWRCYKKHGFIATTALINATLRFLTGHALYDETTPVWESKTMQVATPKPATAAPIAQPAPQTMPPANAPSALKAGATP